MIRSYAEIWRRRAVVSYFVSTQLSSTYRTKSLGFLWALLDPLLFMAVYYVVFGYLLAHRPREFMLHIFVGVIAFRFLSSASAQAATVMRSSGGLIREIQFPKMALPISIVLSRLFDFGAGWVVAAILGILFGAPPNVFWLAIPAVILVQIIFVAGFSLLMAYVGVFFADIQNILDVVLRLLFYLSPVLYPLSVVQDKAGDNHALYLLYMANPMTDLLQSYLRPALEGRLPSVLHIGYALLASLFLLALGTYVFMRAEGQIAKYV